MTDTEIRELDVVALTQDRPDRDLRRSCVGTVVHVHDQDAFEVEFVATSGQAELIATLKSAELLRLRYDSVPNESGTSRQTSLAEALAQGMDLDFDLEPARWADVPRR